MTLPALPESVAKALQLADELGVLKELGQAIEHIVSGDLSRARLSAEEAAIRAAARAPFHIKK